MADAGAQLCTRDVVSLCNWSPCSRNVREKKRLKRTFSRTLKGARTASCKKMVSRISEQLLRRISSQLIDHVQFSTSRILDVELFRYPSVKEQNPCFALYTSRTDTYGQSTWEPSKKQKASAPKKENGKTGCRQPNRLNRRRARTHLRIE